MNALQIKYKCKVLLLDAHKLSGGSLNPMLFKEELEKSLQSFGPIDIFIHNDYSFTQDEFILQEDRNVREFLNVRLQLLSFSHFEKLSKFSDVHDPSTQNAFNGWRSNS